MTAPLDDSVRKMICEDYDEGNAYDTISEERGVLYKTVMIRQYRMGRVESLRKGVINEKLKDCIRELDDPSASLEHIRAGVFKKCGMKVSVTTVYKKRAFIIDWDDYSFGADGMIELFRSD